MNPYLIFIFGAVAGGAAVWITTSLIRANGRIDADAAKEKGLVEKQTEEKKRNKEAILGILDTQSPLTNNHVEQLLGISDATATRYLEELVNTNRLERFGAAHQPEYRPKT